MHKTNRPATQLGRCLVDYDPETVSYARRNRARSMLISLGAQALLLTAAVVIPLVASEKLTAMRILTPGIPYHGSLKPAPPKNEESQRKSPSNKRKFTESSLVIAPPNVPDQIAVINDAPDVGGETNNSADRGISDPNSPIIGLPGGDSKNSALPIVKPLAPKQPRVKTGGDVQAALLIHRIEPKYPPLARQMRLEGQVQLRAIIGRDGSVQELQATSGHVLFIQASFEAVSQWRYRPTLLNGQPVEVETVITVTFKLRRE